MNLFKTLFLVFAIAAVAQADLRDGLEAYWTFDGNLNDSSGAVNDNGTIEGTEGSFSYGEGKFGEAGIFDGEDGYVSVPDSEDLIKGGEDMTISAWFRVDAFDTGWQALLGKGEGRNYRVARQGGDTNFMAYVGGTADLRGGPDVADGEWHHFVGTTKHGGLAAMYIDGVLAEDSSTRDPGAAALIEDVRSSDPAALWIGNNAGAPGREWEGGIDDLAIWNRVLSTSEISYLGSHSVPEPATAGMLALGLLGFLGFRRRR